MQLVELIKGIATNQDTYESCLQVVEKLGKTAASAEDFPAFIAMKAGKSSALAAVFPNFSTTCKQLS